MPVRILAILLLILSVSAPAKAADTIDGSLERQFRDTVLPFMQTYCTDCHAGEKPKGDLDLAPFTSVASVAKDHLRWQLVLERLQEGDMPPEKAKRHPKPELRQEIIAWILAVREDEANRNAGDPGPVLARRLSNAEHDYTIRDLTGVDIRPTREFPVDPANEAGFDNSGESLSMSPALLKKYLEAARRVADHLVLKLDGLAFAPHPVIADTDRDKYCVNQIISFYKRQRTDYSDFFEAAWRFRHRDAVGKPDSTLAEFAAEAGISPKYLATVWATLTEGDETAGPIAALRVMFDDTAAGAKTDADVRAACERMRDFVVSVRAKLVPEVKNLRAPGVHNGSQTMVMWKNRQFSANRRRYAGSTPGLTDVGLPADSVAARLMATPADESARQKYETSPLLIAMTTRVGSGSSAPRPSNMAAKVGMTFHRMTPITTHAITITATG